MGEVSPAQNSVSSTAQTAGQLSTWWGESSDKRVDIGRFALSPMGLLGPATLQRLGAVFGVLQCALAIQMMF